MKQPSRNPRFSARFSPKDIEALDPMAVAVEHPRHRTASGDFNGGGPLALLSEDGTKTLSERKVSALAILRFPWL